jgi:GNAT superfamily N-acetyltransferase
LREGGVTVAVHDATEADRSHFAGLFARAFANDPALSYIFPDPADRAKRLPRLFGLLFDTDGRADGMQLQTAGGEAATLWRPPGKPASGPVEMLLHALPMLHAMGGALGRALAVAHATEAHFPDRPFWYLHIAGCEPAMQGRGLGGAAIRAGLERIPHEMPAYLETPNPRTIGLYTGLGFAVTREWQVPRGGPTFWSMWRAPRALG